MGTILNLIDNAAIMAALALAYGATMRFSIPRRVKDLALGVAFGLGAVISMLQPIFQIGQVIIDCRALFTGFAAAFLGLEGALAALVVASLGRLSISVSPAAFLGVSGMILATTAGRLWQGFESRMRVEWHRLIVLGAMISVSYVVLLLAPRLTGVPVPLPSIALLSVYNIFGALVLGAFLHREMSQARRETLAVAAATTDPLTGLLNRRGFGVGFAAAERDQASTGSAMLVIDLDHFKAVNDGLGHAAGDQVLRQTAERIKGAVRPADLVLRAGGEEFGVLLRDTDMGGAMAFAERIRRVVAAPICLGESGLLRVTASIGGFAWKTGSLAQDQAIAAADDALYRAKTGGRDRTVFLSQGSPGFTPFDDGEAALAPNQRAAPNGLRRALQRAFSGAE